MSTKEQATSVDQNSQHHDYIRKHLEDMPEIRNWRWAADFSEASAPPPLAKGHPRGSLFSDS